MLHKFIFHCHIYRVRSLPLMNNAHHLSPVLCIVNLLTPPSHLFPTTSCAAFHLITSVRLLLPPYSTSSSPSSCLPHSSPTHSNTHTTGRSPQLPNVGLYIHRFTEIRASQTQGNISNADSYPLSISLSTQWVHPAFLRYMP